MKTSIKSIATAFVVALTVFSAFPALSQDEYYSDKGFVAAMYPAKAESKLWLCLKQFKPAEKICLELVDQKGKVLFQEIVVGKSARQSSYRQSFDMSQLGDGKYIFRLSSVSQKEEYSFNLSTPTLERTLPNRLIAIK